MRRGTAGLLTVLFTAMLLGACGPSSAAPATIIKYTQHHCRISPPGVLALSDMHVGGDHSWVPSGQERDAENHYLYAHWGVPTNGIYEDGIDYTGFTDDAQKHLAELRAVVPEPNHVRAYCAPFSEAELGSAKDKIMSDRALTSRGLQFSSIAEGGFDGKLDLMFAHLDPGDEQWIRERYGAIVGSVTEGTVSAN